MSARPISAIIPVRCAMPLHASATPLFLSRIFALFGRRRFGRTHQSARAFIREPFQSVQHQIERSRAKDATGLRRFIDNLLAKRGLAAPEKIFILCYPRILGYAFNPLTVYYCLNDGAVSALVYEVRNTFGDDHIYVVPSVRAAMKPACRMPAKNKCTYRPLSTCTPHIIFLRRCRMTICALLFEKLKTTPPSHRKFCWPSAPANKPPIAARFFCLSDDDLESCCRHSF